MCPAYSSFFFFFFDTAYIEDRFGIYLGLCIGLFGSLVLTGYTWQCNVTAMLIGSIAIVSISGAFLFTFSLALIAKYLGRATIHVCHLFVYPSKCNFIDVPIVSWTRVHCWGNRPDSGAHVGRRSLHSLLNDWSVSQWGRCEGYQLVTSFCRYYLLSIIYYLLSTICYP